MPNHMSPFGGLLLLAATSSLSIAVAAITAAPAAAQQATRYFDIASMPLADAVLEYSRQAQRPVLAPMELMQGKMAPAVQGQMTSDAVLTRLLAGSGLRAVTGQSGGLTLVADTVGGASTAGEHEAGQGPAESASAEWEPEEIIVTGSHIRGVDMAVGSQLITIDRAEIARQSYSTVRDLFEELPQNFGGGATGERQHNASQITNFGYGNSVNLRGLGPTATLVLINGRRVPSTGFTADIPDLSGIPLSAVKRVEVLADGASAVYGSDAVAGVVNLILRDDYAGFETGVRYGTATGTPYDELQLSQLAGFDWAGGSLIVSYEFNRSDRFRRKDSGATETTDFRPFGGLDRRFLNGIPPNIVSPTNEVLYAIPRNQTGVGLAPADLLGPDNATFVDFPAYVDTFPRQTRHSVFGAANLELAAGLKLAVEGRLSRRKFDIRLGPTMRLLKVTPSNPFYIDVFGDQRALSVAYSFENEAPPRTDNGESEDVSATVAVDWQLGSTWSANAYVSYAQNKIHQISGPILNEGALDMALANPNPELAFNPFGSGRSNSPQLIRSLLYQSESAIDANLYQANATASGHLFNLGDNPIRAAFGVEIRREHFDRNVEALGRSSPASLERDVNSVFGEILIPFIGVGNDVPWARRLMLSLSARYERTKDSAAVPGSINRKPQSSTNPRIGARYEPFGGLALRGAYGTSFRAPGLSALTQTPSVYTQHVRDPSDPTRQLYGLFMSGAARDLRNETAKTWSVGLEIDRELTGGARIELSYFKTVFKDNVGIPTANYIEALTDPSWSVFLTRDPTLAEVGAACALAEGGTLQVWPGDCETPGRISFILDQRSKNLARTKVRGIDVSVRVPFTLDGVGKLLASTTGTYLIDYKLAPTATSPYVDRVNTAARPLAWRGRAGLNWETLFGATFSGEVNYANGYRDDVQKRRIGSWTTVDVGASYKLGSDLVGGLISSVTLSLMANNVFDSRPPFYEDAGLLVGYDAANADPFGRRVSLSLSTRW